MTRDTRNPSATRIAVTLGGVVAAVMLGIWGASAIASAMHGGLKPEPKLESVATHEATRSAPAAQASTASAPATVAVKPAAPKPPAPKPAPVPAPVKTPAEKYVVVIDPGHGGELSGNEPVGPNDSTPHPRTAYGATGTNGVTEASIVLKVGLKLRPLLEKQGVKVIMIRTGPRAISNKDRAAIANNAHADLFLRLHCDGVDGSPGTHGISMQVPGSSKEWAPLGSSRKAGEIILGALIRQTGAANKGIVPRSDLAGFNWCKVPTALPEMGFLSNPTEANKLASDSYQNTLAKALADGTMAYLHTVR